MAALFLFGPLAHVSLLEIVLGRAGAEMDLTETEIEGFQLVEDAGSLLPSLSPSDGQFVNGVVMSEADKPAFERVAFFLSSYGAPQFSKVRWETIVLANGLSAEAAFTAASEDGTPVAWDGHEWAERWLEQTQIAAREIMGYFGHRSADEVARRLPVIRQRAASQCRAAVSLHGKDAFQGEVDVVSRTRAYSDFYALDDLKMRHAHFGGGMSGVLDRAVFVGGDAALVLPYDPDRDRVLVVEQIRLGPIGRGDRQYWQIEPIAGRIDAGETPEETVRREAIEEAGVTLKELIPISQVYPSPGTSTEFYYIFLALADLPDGIEGTGGLEAEDEDIRSHVMDFAELMARVEQFDVANGPLALAAYYLACHRDRLRSA